MLYTNQKKDSKGNTSTVFMSYIHKRNILDSCVDAPQGLMIFFP